MSALQWLGAALVVGPLIGLMTWAWGWKTTLVVGSAVAVMFVGLVLLGVVPYAAGGRP